MNECYLIEDDEKSVWLKLG